METYLSDADREAETESSSQSNEKQGESFNTNAIYAVPSSVRMTKKWCWAVL